MSQKFAKEFGKKKYTREDVRKFVQKSFPYNKEGRPIYVTEQGHKKECDVNEIIKKYDREGVITHVNRFEAMYADVSAISFENGLRIQQEISEKFMELPSEIRKRFENSPLEYLKFLGDPRNNEEAIALGLRKNDVKPVEMPSDAKKKVKAQDHPPDEK